MSNDDSRVIETAGATANSCSVYHRDLGEIRAEGENPRAASEQLLNALTRALDSALTEWRRQTLENAIADVKRFIQDASK